MDPWLLLIKDNIISLIDGLKSSFPTMKFKVGIIGYRDISDDIKFEY